MKKILLTLLFTLFAFHYAEAYATSHHSGHIGGARSAGDNNCTKPRMEKFLPPNMATVAPGSEFSFAVFNMDKSDQIVVTVKKLPVEVITEFKAPFYWVTGKLPDSLRNTVARINAKINKKTNSCEAENGWLVKISE
jgi:hypothetical protein